MTYNMRLFVGSAVILLMAVVFAQPVLAQGTESYTSIVGMNDITQWITNPSFEQNVATYGQYLANTYNGWTLNTGSKDSATFRPTTNAFLWRSRRDSRSRRQVYRNSRLSVGLYAGWVHDSIGWRPSPGSVENRVYRPDPRQQQCRWELENCVPPDLCLDV